MDLAERDRLDKEFIEEFEKLCRKYNRRLYVDWMDGFNVEEMEGDDDYISIGGIRTQADNEESYRIQQENERKRREAQQREWEEQHRKRVEAHLAAGGTLDENGNIPISPNYCQLIEWHPNR
jgi:hypothetical protein